MKKWNGEVDEFSITTLDGIEQLRNLMSYKSIMLDLDDADISALLKCQKLEFIYSSYTPDTEHISLILRHLKENRIQIENY